MKTVIIAICLFGSLPLMGCRSGYTGQSRLRTYSSRRLAPPPQPTLADRWATAKIRGKLMWDYLVDAEDITVQTVNGVVTLRGFVPHREVRKRAVVLARETEGVREVISELHVVRGGRYVRGREY